MNTERKTFLVIMPRGLHKQFKMLAAMEETSMGAIITRLIKEEVEGKGYNLIDLEGKAQ